jgi:hypothetical protein
VWSLKVTEITSTINAEYLSGQLEGVTQGDAFNQALNAALKDGNITKSEADSIMHASNRDTIKENDKDTDKSNDKALLTKEEFEGGVSTLTSTNEAIRTDEALKDGTISHEDAVYIMHGVNEDIRTENDSDDDVSNNQEFLSKEEFEKGVAAIMRGESPVEALYEFATADLLADHNESGSGLIDNMPELDVVSG